MAARPLPLSWDPSEYEVPAKDLFTQQLEYFDQHVDEQWAKAKARPPGDEVVPDLGLPTGGLRQPDPFAWLTGVEFPDDDLWTAEESGPEDVPVAPKEDKSLSSTPIGFGTDVGNLLQFAHVPQLVAGGGSENAPPTMDVAHQADPHDEDHEVSFDFDQDTTDVVWYYPWKKDEEDDDETGDEIETVDGESVIEEHDFVARPVSPAIALDKSSEEEDVLEENKDIVPVPVSDPTVVPSDDDTSATPQSVCPPEVPEIAVIDSAPSPLMNSQLRWRKRPRSDNDDSDDDGDDSGDYGAPARRPRKKTRRARVAPRLDRQTDVPVAESEISSASNAPGGHNEGGMDVHRVSAHSELTCGFPGCKKVLRVSELARARKHYRSHYKRKDKSWAVRKGTKVACNWSGCTKRFTLGEVQTQRHLEAHHFGILYECPKCKIQVTRGTNLEMKHIPKCRGSKEGVKPTSKRGQSGKNERSRSRRGN